jgi:hypothetical protein
VGAATAPQQLWDLEPELLRSVVMMELPTKESWLTHLPLHYFMSLHGIGTYLGIQEINIKFCEIIMQEDHLEELGAEKKETKEGFEHEKENSQEEDRGQDRNNRKDEI